jgi:hypothetical protein
MNVLVVSEERNSTAIFGMLRAIIEIEIFIVGQPVCWERYSSVPLDLVVWQGKCDREIWNNMTKLFPQAIWVLIDDEIDINIFPFDQVIREINLVSRPAVPIKELINQDISGASD